MKTFSYILLLGFIPCISFSQIPNNGFENWTTNYTQVLQGWESFGKVSKVITKSNGRHAIKLERRQGNTNEPGEIIYGERHGNNFSGGIPFTGRPDSIVADFKYYLPLRDSAWVLVFLKNKGNFISRDVFKITGSNLQSFVRKAFKINYTSTLTPDSLIIGFTSTDPNKNYAGGYVIIDAVHFTNTSLTLPNGDFESWKTIFYDDPKGWDTPNDSLVGNQVFSVTKTTDIHLGKFAAKIENVNSSYGIQGGYMFAGSQPQGDPYFSPGFPENIRDTVFSGYYKFLPQNKDTATIGVFMFSKGVRVGSGIFSTSIATTDYTAFMVSINYAPLFNGIPDSAKIALLPFVRGSKPHGNSVLFIDDLAFGDTTAAINPIVASEYPSQISVYPNPAHNLFTIKYNLQDATHDVSITIYTLSGNLIAPIYEGKQFGGEQSIDYNSSLLKNGSYVIEVLIDNIEVNIRLVIQN